MTQRAWIGVAITALVLFAALLAVWFVSMFERQEQSIHVGLRGEARRNPLLACERTFAALGLPSTSRPYLGVLPPTEHLLVLRETGRFLSPVAVAGLVDWVVAGGHLLLLVPADSDSAKQREGDLERGRFELPVARELGVTCVAVKRTADARTIELGSGVLNVELRSELAFADARGTADVVVGAREKSPLLSYVHGQGRVTFVASDAWITNKRLDEHDHARAAWQLAQLGGARSGALLVYGEKPPAFLALLVEHGWMVLVSLAALLALYFARVGTRFGPLLPAPSRDRRDFSEHVIATGEFLWRHGAGATLLEAPRKELRRKLHLTRPDLADLPLAALAPALAALSGLAPERVTRALEPSTLAGGDEFTLVVRDLQLLRKAL